jgi:hypothetical protein
MSYLTESVVRNAARVDARVVRKAGDAAAVLRESVQASAATDEFDVFLCHSIRDAELVQGTKAILESLGLRVYVDWIVDPQMDRSAVTAETARILRGRMQHSRSLLYLFTSNSKRSRWMPWELGYFDGFNGTVGILPVLSEAGAVEFTAEEYLALYPKVEVVDKNIFVNRTLGLPVRAEDKENWRTFETWVSGSNKLRL